MSIQNTIRAANQARINKQNSRVHLQGIGLVPAMLAGEIQVGDTESRNYYSRKYIVTKIVRQTAKTIWYEVKDLTTGVEYPVRRLKSALAPVERLSS